MIEVQILVPVAGNDGAEFSADHHEAFETFAAELFGGVTRLPSNAAGVWIEAGTVYRDETRVYVVALASITDGGKVRTLADFVKAHYAQLAVYVRYLGTAEVLK